jgi:hypothetical protein
MTKIKDVIKEILQDLLEYEGGEMQSIRELVSCGIKLDLSGLGRK